MIAARPYALGAFFALYIAHLCGSADAPEAPAVASPFKGLKYRLVGPAAGGRVCRVAGIAGDPLTYYAATASSGVWKSGDGGINWKPIFDDQPVSSVGSIAVASSDPNVIYVGTGEANIRGNVEAGNGIFKSIDAGKTWKHVWKQEGQIGTMLVHPTNPDIAFAAVLGHAFGPNGERGVYRTKDGGASWQQVLKKDADTGASDVCFDPSNPSILFAGMWQARRRPWDLTSGGPGSGLYISRDGGDTWKQLGPNPVAAGVIPSASDQAPGVKPAATEQAAGVKPSATDQTTGVKPPATDKAGLPLGPWGRVCVAVAPSDGRRVYAMIEAEKGGLYRSDDGGETWQAVSYQKAIRQRPWYFSTITVDPKNRDVVWCPQVALMRSIDGGKSFQSVKGPHHGDHHDVWIDPHNTKRIMDGNDGGIDLSTNNGESWYAPPLPIAQFYHIGVDNRVPYHVSGTMQDIGAMAGPTNSLNNNGIRLSDWYSIGGGETGYVAHDPTDPNIIYAGEYAGYISRYDHRTRQPRNVSIYPYRFSGEAEDLKYRFRWPAPLMLSPHDPKTIYHAANVLLKSTDAGAKWTAISGDLTRNDKSKQKWSGGPISGDNTSAEHYCTISTIAESLKQKDLLWAGSDDGLVHVSKDGGKNWTNVTANIPGLPEWATVDCIEPSQFDAGTAYVVVDAHILDNMRPYLYQTADFGQTWKNLSDSLPQDQVLHVVREDPKKKGQLYLGTSRSVMFSTDSGTSWQPLKLNMPTVAIHDLIVKNDDLVVGTNGRSIWILDDLTPLREMSNAVADADVFIFPPVAATRWRPYVSIGEGKPTGQNPPFGASITYSLKRKPKGDVTIEILDDKDEVVRKLSSKPDTEGSGKSEGDYEEEKPERPVVPAEAGIQRTTWDLMVEAPAKAKGAKLDAGELTDGPMALPGTYTLKLTADGKTATAKLTVAPDPRNPATLAELEDQYKFCLPVRDEINRLVKTITQLRAVQKQLTSRNELLADDPKHEPLVKASKELLQKIDLLENKLHNPKAQVAYDILTEKGGAMLYSKLGLLYSFVTQADGAPTQGMREVFADHQRDLQQLEMEWKKLIAEDLAKLNEQAKSLDVPVIFVPTGVEKKS